VARGPGFLRLNTKNLKCQNYYSFSPSLTMLIVTYFAWECIMNLEGNKKFVAIDKAIGENGFSVVTSLL
jgi:hypothetical protein